MTGSTFFSLRAGIHPFTSHLIYLPFSTSNIGFFTTPLFSPSVPCHLPTPSDLLPGEQLSVSPDGRRIFIFHPSPSSSSSADSGGRLAIYPSSILSPFVNASSVTPLDILSLPSTPLAIQHLYSSSEPIGPHAPPSYDPSHGPAFLLVTPALLMLFHPQMIPSSIQLDATNSTAIDDSPLRWGMNILRSPLNMRYHSAVGSPTFLPLPETGGGVRRAWLGTVSGNDGVWCGLESDGDLRVVRAEVGVDGSGRYCELSLVRR